MGLLETDPSLLVLAGALLMDATLGEPPTPLHPVVWMGHAVSFLERRAPRHGPVPQLFAGVFMAVAVPALFALLARLVLEVGAAPRAEGGSGLAVVLGFLAQVVVLKSMFAVRALGMAALAVRAALARGDVDDARHGLRSLCSRDASRLDEPLIAAGAIESLAENASDSFVAPLFYYALLGLPGAVFYRTVNTLDSMIGYHGKYEYLGKASARLDDVLNFVPARLTAVLLVLAGRIVGCDARAGWDILTRDGARTESPNAGRPMAAMAGILNIQLEKVGHYRLGDGAEVVGVRHIDVAWRVVRLGAGLTAVVFAAMIGLIHAH